MKRAIIAAIFTVFGLSAAERALAQPQLGSLLPNPRLSAVSPCGGRVNTAFEATFVGTDLEDPEQMIFSHPGIKAVPVLPPTPPQPKPDPKKPAPKPTPPPPVTSFKVTIAANVPVGIYDVRMVNRWGITNPRAFAVGDLPEVAEKEPNNDVEQAQRVAINTTINGTISAGTDVDYFVFAGKKGQRVIVSCLASSLDSRLEADLRLFDAEGKQLAFNREYTGSDALVDLTLPADGDYQVRLCQFTYEAGNAEYFYRLSISTAPWIDAIHPCAIEPGKTAKVTVFGRNLPGGVADDTVVVDGRVLEKITVSITAPSDSGALQRLAYQGRKPTRMMSIDGFEYRIKNGVGTSNPFLLTYARAPVVLDNEANDTPETAQEVAPPCEIAGRVEKKHDRDWYSLTLKKGDVYNIEVLSDRLGAPTDMYFVLYNPTAKQEIAEIDAHSEALAFPPKFFANTEDPGVYTFTAPADGKYQLMVTSRTSDSTGSVRHYYRVRITPAQPDFHVVVMHADSYRPDAACLRQGGTVFYSVFAWRHDGFNGEITLTVDGLPKGVTCPPQTLGPALKAGRLVLMAAADAPLWTGEIKVKATAKINGKAVEREARYASITWPIPPQQNLQPPTRLDDGLALAVREKAPFRLTTGMATATVAQGGKVTVPLTLDRFYPDFKTPVQILPDVREIPPALLTHAPVTIPANGNAGSLLLNIAASAQPGTYSVSFRCFAPVPFNKDPMAKARPPVNVVQVTTPLTLIVLPTKVATVSVVNPSPTIKIGAQAEVVVRVARLFDYAGEFKVQLVLPPNTAPGLSAAEATIPAGQTETKLIVKVAPNAAVGNRPNLIVKTTALYNGTVPLTQDVPINVNVIK